MNKLFLSLKFILLCTLSINAQNVSWLTNEGGPIGMRAESIAVDPDGFIYVTGGYHGSTSIGQFNLSSSGDEDIFLAKFNPNGQVIWATKAGGTNQDLPFSIAIDHDNNIYITGFYEQNCTFDDTTFIVAENQQVFLAKYDSSGSFLWARHGGSYNASWSKSVEIDNDNNVYIAGFIGDDSTFEDTTITGSNSLFIIKYNSDGDLLYAKSGNGKSDINSLCIDNNNNIYITGDYYYDLTLDTFTIDNNAFISNYFFAKLDPNGNTQWVNNCIESSTNYGTAIVLDSNNDICFTIMFFDTIHIDSNQYVSNGSYDIILGKMNSNGNLIWHKHFGGGNMWEENSLAVDAFNNIYLSMSITDTDYFEGIPYTANNEDAIILKFDPNGNIDWVFQGTGNDQDYCSALAISDINHLYFTGSFSSSSLTIYNQSVTLSGWGNMFLGEISNINDIKLVNKSEINIYPNPSKDFIYITSNNDINNIEVFNILGKHLFSVPINSRLYRLDISEINEKIIILKVFNDKEIITKKIIKE